MTNTPKEWHRYETLRPGELARVVAERPVAFWPLGLLEHHGWHLPVGFDGLKAERICTAVAGRTGGVVLPTMWWGGGGGHGKFHWTLYQDETAARSVYETTVRGLLSFGFRVVVTLAGHYPWLSILNAALPAIRSAYPDATILAGTEMEIADNLRLPGDHAALEETSYGLALLPELVDLEQLRPHDARSDPPAWPPAGAPPPEDRHPAVDFDPTSPTFAQMGDPATRATAERGSRHVAALVQALAARIDDALARVVFAG